MSEAGLKGMQLAADDVFYVTSRLSESDWETPSAASGWTVHDIVIHFGNLLEVLIEAVNGSLEPPDQPVGIEELNEMQVAQRRGHAPGEAVDYFSKQMARARQVFAPLQHEPTASVEAELLDLGAYPLHAIVDMFAFDISTHLRWDILGPRGPIGLLLPAMDDARLAPAVSWLLGGIPKMQTDLAEHLKGTIELILTGPAATTVSILARDGAVMVGSPADTATPAARVISSTFDFMAWSTRRIDWRDAVTVEGDSEVAREFLDHLNLI